jgi:carboxypeptidase C (cathepsin A)
MRLLFFIMTLVTIYALMPFSAHAQTQVSKETANQYFDNCVKSVSPQQPISTQTQEMLCACTAARLTQFFSMEDMQTMTGTEPVSARAAYNKMMVNIYAPCMEEPTREYYTKVCTSNPDTVKYGDPQKICPCMANKIAVHMATNGPRVFSEILSENPNVMDPMAALLGDPKFERFAQSQLLSCLK